VNTCDEKKGLADATTGIFNNIKEMCKYTPSNGVDCEAIEKRAINRGYSQEQFVITVKHY